MLGTIAIGHEMQPINTIYSFLTSLGWQSDELASFMPLKETETDRQFQHLVKKAYLCK